MPPTAVSLFKRAAKGIVPPVLWAAARAVLKPPAPPPPPPEPPPEPVGPAVRVLTTVEELDREVRRAEALRQTSDDLLRQAVTEFRFDPGVPFPPDPDSPEYRAAQMELYGLISGRPGYDPATAEQTEFDVAECLTRPFPYGSGSGATVGEQLMAIGFLLRAGEFREGQRVLEFGPGWGNTTLALARTGCRVTAVDINPRFLELVHGRCRATGVGPAVETVCADMLDFRTGAKYDRVLFFESFHHARDHADLVRRLDGLVAPGGAVVFAGEPVNDDFPHPWGVRTDGISVWSTRTFGWLELGFRTDYFEQLLARHGWTADRHDSRDVPWNRVFVARRATSGCTPPASPG